MSEEIKLSVCLLSFNHSKVIEQVIKSILKQTYRNFELIISDDCSRDNTWQLLVDLERSDSRIKLIQTPKNIGMAGNTNFAFNHAKGKYIALLHHDDICEPTLLDSWVLIMDRYRDISFVFNQYINHSSGYLFPINGLKEVNDGEMFFKNYLLSSWGCPVRGTALIRKDDFIRVGGMNEKFSLLADIDLWMRLSMISNVGYVDQPLLRVNHQRPDDYPEDYLDKVWSWGRLRLLYEIHAENILRYAHISGAAGLLLWLKFRFKLNIETAKWLTYAVIRKREDMISSCNKSITPYDYQWLILYRKFLCKLYRHEK